jgi:hypothetical protein
MQRAQLDLQQEMFLGTLNSYSRFHPKDTTEIVIHNVNRTLPEIGLL